MLPCAALRPADGGCICDSISCPPLSRWPAAACELCTPHIGRGYLLRRRCTGTPALHSQAPCQLFVFVGVGDQVQARHSGARRRLRPDGILCACGPWSLSTAARHTMLLRSNFTYLVSHDSRLAFLSFLVFCVSLFSCDCMGCAQAERALSVVPLALVEQVRSSLGNALAVRIGSVPFFADTHGSHSLSPCLLAFQRRWRIC